MAEMAKARMVMVRITINGFARDVRAGTSVAAAVASAGPESGGDAGATRRSSMGQLRGPLCGMGLCFECRVTIQGQAHQRSCQILCADGMEISTR